MHFHRDVMAACACWPPHVLRAERRRRVHRQPAAGLHLRPGRAAAVSDERGRVDGAGGEGLAADLMDAVVRVRRDGAVHRAHLVPRDRVVGAGPAWPAPTLRKCVSAGEALPAATRKLWCDVSRHRDHRRHRLDRDAAHLHLGRRARSAARRHRQGGAGLCGLRDGRRRPAAAAGPGRPAGGEGARPAAATWTTRARRPT